MKIKTKDNGIVKTYFIINLKKIITITIISIIGLIAVFTLAKNAERIDKQQTIYINR